MFHHILNIDVSIPRKSFPLTFFFLFFGDNRELLSLLLLFIVYFIRQLAQTTSLLRVSDTGTLVYSEMLRFKRVRANSYFGEIIIVSLSSPPPKTYFICFSVQKADSQSRIYKEKNHFLLSCSPMVLPLLPPLTSSQIIQALFSLRSPN